MRNLKLLNLTRAKLNSAENNVVQFSSDGINENIYIVTKDNTLYGVNIKTNKVNNQEIIKNFTFFKNNQQKVLTIKLFKGNFFNSIRNR